MSVEGWGYIGMSAIAYAVWTVAGAIPDWAHIVLAAFIVTVLLASSYPDDLAAITKMFRGASPEPLSNAELLSRKEARTVRIRFAKARQAQALRRKHFRAQKYAQSDAHAWPTGSEPHASGHASRA
jgi:hypothetical protein